MLLVVETQVVVERVEWLLLPSSFLIVHHLNVDLVLERVRVLGVLCLADIVYGCRQVAVMLPA